MSEWDRDRDRATSVVVREKNVWESRGTVACHDWDLN